MIEILSTILEYLPTQDLLRCARVSRRMREMVYDDTRWVYKLKLMGVWDEPEARKRFEEAMRRKRALQAARAAEEEKKALQNGVRNIGAVINAAAGDRSSTLFDAGEEESKAKMRRWDLEAKRRTLASSALGEGFDLMNLAPLTSVDVPRANPMDPASLLKVLPSVRSIRGFARQEFGRIYGALGPLYFDLAKAKTHTDPVVFRMYRDPEQQAQVLAQLRVFAQSDTAYGWADRLERLNLMIGIFENAALREFEGLAFPSRPGVGGAHVANWCRGYETGDVDGRMKRYANVLILLNGGQACVQLFVQKHPVMFEREKLGNSMDCFEYGYLVSHPADLR
jgi:recyclin-1